jgi:hypothetical protein
MKRRDPCPVRFGGMQLSFGWADLPPTPNGDLLLKAFAEKYDSHLEIFIPQASAHAPILWIWIPDGRLVLFTKIKTPYAV